jgi:uncharacterized membrane protein HdeD (DUF308 family)
MEDINKNSRDELIKILQKHTGTATGMGIVLVLAGLLALTAPLVAGLSLVLMMGAIILVGGISQLIFAFKAGSFGEGLLTGIMGILTALLGAYMLSNPGIALATLTLILAAWFAVVGVCEIIWALRLRPLAGWGMTIFSGVISLLLGVMIWRQFPVSGAWAVGVLAGIKFLFSGWWLIVIARGVKQYPVEAA